MRHASARLFVVYSALTLFASCDNKSPFAPDDDAVLATFSSASPALSSTTISSTRIDLSWEDVSNLEDGYELHRSTGTSGIFTLVHTTGPDVTSHGDVGLSVAAEYCYKVRAFRKTGRKTVYSAYSATSCATTLTGPRAPSALAARPSIGLANVVQLTWIDNSGDENGFRIERASSPDGPWSLTATTSANVTSYTDNDRPSEQQLCYRVTAFDVAGGTSPSNVDCTFLPAPPTLSVADASATAVDLAWTDNSAHEESYEIERVETGGWPFVTVATVPANAIAFRDAGVIADKTYTYRVWATHEGVRVSVSNSVNAITAAGAPSAPSSLDVSPSGSDAVVGYWADASATEAGFRVERSDNGGGSWGIVASAPANNTSFFDPERVPDQQVCYRVIAFNAHGDSPPSPVDCTAPPAGPTDLVATTAPGFAIDLTWRDNSSVEDGYEVQRYYQDCPGYYYYCYQYYVTIATLGPNATSYQDAGLGAAVEHTYQIVAVKDGGYSAVSNQASAWSTVPPAAPSGLTATAVSRTQIDLAWSDNSTNELNFLVSRCTGAVASCGNANFTVSFWVGANISTFSDTTAEPNTTYTYRVFSYNGFFSEPSIGASATSLP